MAAFLEVETKTVSRNGCGTHGFLAPECLEKNEFCEKSDLSRGCKHYCNILQHYCSFEEQFQGKAHKDSLVLSREWGNNY